MNCKENQFDVFELNQRQILSLIELSKFKKTDIFFDFVYTSPSIGSMKKICSNIDGIPVFRFHIDLEYFLIDIT